MNGFGHYPCGGLFVFKIFYMEFISGILFGLGVGVLISVGLKLSPKEKTTQWLIWGSLVMSAIIGGVAL